MLNAARSVLLTTVGQVLHRSSAQTTDGLLPQGQEHAGSGL
jgi:hypothetical protein